MERGKEDEDTRSYPLIPWSGFSAGPIWSSGSSSRQAWVLGWKSYWKEKMHDYSWHIPRSIITSDTSLGPENKPVWKIEMNLLCSISGDKLLCCPSTNDAWKTFWIDLTWDMEVFPYENILHGLMKRSQATTFLLVTWLEMFNSLLNALKALTNFKSGGKGEGGMIGRRRGDREKEGSILSKTISVCSCILTIQQERTRVILLCQGGLPGGRILSPTLFTYLPLLVL